MPVTPRPFVLVTGAAGRFGALLRAAWALDPPGDFDPLWHCRADPPPGWLAWDMLAAPCPALDPAPAAILNLAGVPPGGPGRSDGNLVLARAAAGAARSAGCRHLFLASSAAVYGATANGRESHPPHPASRYGADKARMESAARRWAGPRVTILRIGNVVGADGLLGAARPGVPVMLDPAGTYARGPLRSWIGPATLAATLAALVARALAGRTLPSVVNVAQTPPLPMASLLEAAGMPWQFGAPCPATIAQVALDTRRLAGILAAPLRPACPAGLVAEWRNLAAAA